MTSGGRSAAGLNSRRAAAGAEQATETIGCFDASRDVRRPFQWNDQLIVEPLGSPLFVVMSEILTHRVAERLRTEQDQLIEAL